MLVAALLQRVIKITQQLALMLGELDGRLHQNVAIQIAWVAGAHALDAFDTLSLAVGEQRGFEIRKIGQVNKLIKRNGKEFSHVAIFASLFHGAQRAIYQLSKQTLAASHTRCPWRPLSVA